MYVRFVSPARADRGRGHYGIFDAAGGVIHDRAADEPLRRAIREELDWFNVHLPVPTGSHFRVKSRKHWYAEGICWFRAEAREMVRHAHLLAALVSELGVPIARLHTRRPGQILYRDDWQVVAKPAADTPVRWH
jgi:hypothetical protein